MMKKTYLPIGFKSGKLTVVSYSHSVQVIQGQGYRYYYNVICECGAEKKILEYSLKIGKTKSCGCLIKEIHHHNAGDKHWNYGNKNQTSSPLFIEQTKEIIEYILANPIKRTLRDIMKATDVPLVKIRRMLRPDCYEFRKGHRRNMSYHNEFIEVSKTLGYNIISLPDTPYIDITPIPSNIQEKKPMKSIRDMKYWDMIHDYISTIGSINSISLSEISGNKRRNSQEILQIFFNEGKLERELIGGAYVFFLPSVDETYKTFSEVEENIMNDLDENIDENNTCPQPPAETVGDGFSRYTKTDLGEEWHIQCGKKKLIVPKTTLKRLKELYCGDRHTCMTVNQVCRELNLKRDQFTFISAAFGITHDDIPFDDEDIENNSLDDLVEQTLENKKKNYFLKLKDEEIKSQANEIAKLRNRVFIEQEILNRMESMSFDSELCFPFGKGNTEKEGLLCIQDIHYGLKANNFWNVYDTQIAKERMDELITSVIIKSRIHGISKINIFSLGDLVHGMIHVSARVQSEINMVEQIVGSMELVACAIDNLCAEFEIEYHQTRGNHGRMTSDKFASIAEENYEDLILMFLKTRYANNPRVNIHTDNIDGDIIYREILGHPVFGIHGHNDKIKNVAGDLSLMVNIKPEQIFMGHKHHSQSEEIHGIDVIIGESFCGFESYAKSIRCMAHAGQSFYIYDKAIGLECEYKIRFG